MKTVALTLNAALSLLAACASGGSPGRVLLDASTPIARDSGAASSADARAAADAPAGTDGPADAPLFPGDDRAYLHADVWSTFWNDRTRCGAERTFLEVCERRGGDCGAERAAWAACDPTRVVYGQIGPERSGERVCMRGALPDVGGCDARRFDFDRLRFRWYGAEWAGNWPFATLKIFPAGTSDPTAWLGPGLVAVSNLPGRAQAAMDGVANHGLDRDGDGISDSTPCAMLGETSGDGAYRRPFGAFAWIEVPIDVPVVVVTASSTNFGDRAFAGCSRGAATASPWLEGTPGSVLGCVHAVEHTFRRGRHYVMRYGRIEELTTHGPPPEIVAGFALPEVGLDVSRPGTCER